MHKRGGGGKKPVFFFFFGRRGVSFLRFCLGEEKYTREKEKETFWEESSRKSPHFIIMKGPPRREEISMEGMRGG